MIFNNGQNNTNISVKIDQMNVQKSIKLNLLEL